MQPELSCHAESWSPVETVRFSMGQHRTFETKPREFFRYENALSFH